MTTLKSSERYLVDTSVWVEYFRRTGSRADQEATRMIERAEPTAGITEPVLMELLAGARDAAIFGRIERITDAMPLLAVYPPCDFGEAGSLFLTLRRNGKTIGTVRFKGGTAVFALGSHAPVSQKFVAAFQKSKSYLARTSPPVQT